MPAVDSNTRKTFLVTGATGFLAGHVITQLLEQGHSVRATVRNVEKGKSRCQYLIAKAQDAKCTGDISFIECDLLESKNWDKAVAGVDGVFHTASPNPIGLGVGRPAEELIKPAVGGVEQVLKACSNEPSVKRVVMTSSCVALTSANPTPGHETGVVDEKSWTNLDVAGEYEQSKTLAEQFAWDFMRENEGKLHFDLSTVLPCYIQGPILTKEHGLITSTELVVRALQKADPACPPQMPLNVCDVRDVALMHLRCMEVPKAGGERYLAFSKFFWHHQLHSMLAEYYNPLGYNITTLTGPYPLLWFLGRFDKTIKAILPSLGHYHTYSTAKAEKDLGMKFRDGFQAVVDMGNSLIEFGVVPDRSKPGMAMSRNGPFKLALALAASGIGFYFAYNKLSNA